MKGRGETLLQTAMQRRRRAAAFTTH